MLKRKETEESGEDKRQRIFDNLSWRFAGAVRSGNLEECKKIVNDCAVEDDVREELLNSVCSLERTFLHIAAENNQAPIISWLLSEGGGRSLGFNSVLATADGEETALHYAVRNDDLEACKALVNGCRSNNGEQEEILNAVDYRGWTALHLAALHGHTSIIVWLFSEGGGRSLGFSNLFPKAAWEGRTALHFAAGRESPECFLAIVHGCTDGERRKMINAVDSRGMTILHEAAEYARTSVIGWILSKDGGRAAGFNLVTARTEDELHTALHYTMQHFDAEATRALLSNCTSQERTSLFLAVDPKHGWTALHHAVQQWRLDIITVLLSYPECAMIVNRKDNRGMTALHRAIVGGFDKESRKEWDLYRYGGRRFEADEPRFRVLLGLDENSSSSSSSLSTSTITKAWIDPNIGLGL